ncbi:CD8A protein, partial [Pitta sordida]|nr:CD8A protein [Pitta sordida]
MDRSPALLLLLTLGFCEYGHRAGQPLQWEGQENPSTEFKKLGFTQLQVGQRLEMECQTDRESGAFWIRQDKSGTLHFIVFISSISRATFEGNQKTSRRFEASKDKSLYRLVVKSFTPQDEGNYFCLMNINQMLLFSPGLSAFLPVTTTVTPTTQHGFTETTSHLKTPDPEPIMEKDLNFSCDIIIWVPLAGTCLLLLIALAITIMLCQRTRRRRCRCKR